MVSVSKDFLRLFPHQLHQTAQGIALIGSKCALEELQAGSLNLVRHIGERANSSRGMMPTSSANSSQYSIKHMIVYIATVNAGRDQNMHVRVFLLNNRVGGRKVDMFPANNHSGNQGMRFL